MKRQVRFLNSQAEIVLLEGEFSKEKDAGAKKIAPRSYEVYFPIDVGIPVIIHELWHIFFDALSSFGDEQITCKDLSTDIYAYSFENFVRDILTEWEDIKLGKN